MEKNKIYRMIQYFITVFMIMLFFFSSSDSEDELLTLKGGMLFIPLLLWVCNFVLFVLETKFKGSIIRKILFIFGTIIILLVLDDLELAAAASMLFSIVYLFMLLFSNVTVSKIEKNENGEKKFPVGIFTTKQNILNLLSFILYVIIAIVLYYVFDKILNLGLLVSFLIVFISLFTVILIVNYNINPFNKILLNFNSTLDFKTYEEEINKLLNNNLHSDSINYLKLMYVNYYYLVNKEEACNYFNEISVPNFKTYQMYYDLIAVLNAINTDDKDKAYELLGVYKNKYSKFKKNVEILERTLIANFTNDEILNVKMLYPIDKNLIIFKVVNAQFLMTYYLKRDNLDEAKVYAKFLLDNCKNLDYIYKEAEDILKS